MPLPPRTMSIHDAPQAGEVTCTILPTRWAYDPSAAGTWAAQAIDERNRRATLTPEQEDADAREQGAIADAVEGVIP